MVSFTRSINAFLTYRRLYVPSHSETVGLELGPPRFWSLACRSKYQLLKGVCAGTKIGWVWAGDQTTRTQLQTDRQTDRHTHICTHTNTHTHTYTSTDMRTHTHTKQFDNLHFRSADAAAPLRSQCRRGRWTSCGLVPCQTAASTPKSWPLSGSEGPGDTCRHSTELRSCVKVKVDVLGSRP